LTGDTSDKEYVDNVCQQLKHKDKVINIAGIYSLKQFFVVIKSVKLFISNDSGPLHVAIAYQTPTISFFGPETPIIYGPNFHPELHKVFFMNLFCSPCISVFRDKNFICTNQNKCMSEILPDKVLQQIDYFLLNKSFK
jgi:heptosyltransferase II